MQDQFIATPVGLLVARWSDQGLYAIDFRPQPPPRTALASARHASAKRLARSIEDFFDHGKLNWDLQQNDWTGVSEFHRRVLEHCFAIPAGRTLSYGKLAALAGKPMAARAVGGAMAKNRWPIVIPCHRVVGVTGRLTGYSGRGGIATKQRLLDLERKLCRQPDLISV